MSQTKYLLATADTTVKSNGTGAGKSTRLYSGIDSADGKTRSSFILFGLDWTGVGKIISATLQLYTDDHGDSAFPVGTAPTLVAERLTSAFTEGASAVLAASDYTNPAFTAANIAYNLKPPIIANTQLTLDITDIVGLWAPSTVQQANGKVGAGLANDGIRLGPVHWKAVERLTVWSKDYTDPAKRPQIALVYEPAVGPPNAPTNTSTLPLSLDGVSSFEGDFTDPNPANWMTKIQVNVYASDGVTLLWSQSNVAAESERSAAHFSIVPSNLILKPGTLYKWAAQVQNNQNQWSDFSTLQNLTLVANPPTQPTLSPTSGSFATFQGIPFIVNASTPDAGAYLTAFQVQMAPTGSNFDDPTALVWDSGQVWGRGGPPPAPSSSGPENYAGSGSAPSTGTGSGVMDSAPPTTSGTGSPTGYMELPYGGESLLAGTYQWRARVWDSHGGVSSWSLLGSLTLTQDFQYQPGGTVAYPVVHDTHAPWRIVLRGMGANRGPGAIVAIIEDAHAVGASIMYNSAGEFHFTLPVSHPQLSVCEPRQTHYALEFYTADGYREMFAGLLFDYDANEREVVFTGIDYLALLNYVVDDRFDINHPDQDYLHGGSKYVNVSIQTAITQELTYAINLANSPIGFLTVGTIDAALTEMVTLWSAQQTVMHFVGGLVESHRQGTGKMTRLSVVRTSPMYSAPAYSVQVVDDPGTQRDNLRLSYGELVQGYRVIPFGDKWASRINFLGTSRAGVNVFYETAQAPGIDESVWGRFAMSQVQANIADENDAKRRAAQAAATAGKLGRQIGVGIRQGYLRPREGYDICDSIPVKIVHGAVDTDNFGSGYWNIVGIVWESFADAHWMTTLTLLPREDAVAPDPDLIPSAPLDTNPEWQIDWVPPDPVAGSNAAYYLDQSSHKVYQRQPDGTYEPLTHDPRNNNGFDNSGFEITPIATLFQTSWSADHAWSTATSQVNLNTAGGSLAMTTSAY